MDLKVLITTYHQAYLTRGGGEYEIQSIAEGLRQLGIIADIYGPYSRSLEFYDVALHFSVHPGGIGLLRELERRGMPIVLWPNIWLSSLSKEGGELITEYVALSKWVAFKSRAELDNFREKTGISSNKFVTCKWVADLVYLRPAPRDLFRQLYDIEQYALWFGIIEPIKNQLAAVRVTRKMGIPLVLVGGYRDRDYYFECRRAGGGDVLFLDGLPQKSAIVRSALQDALFYIELSYEPPGLSAIEAGLSGCRMLLSDSSWAREHFLEHAEYVKPNSDESIEKGIQKILSRPRRDLELQKHMMEYCFPNAMIPLVEILKKAMQ